MSTISQKELDEFRAEAAAWVKKNAPASPGFMLPLTFMEVGTDAQFNFLREWQNKVYEAGYLGAAWPKEYGGHGLDQAFQDFIAYYSEHIADHTVLWPGVLAQLERLADHGAAMAVCTNKIESLAHQVLEALSLTHFFPVVIGGDTLPVKKPHPDHLLEAVRRLGGDAGQAIMVGDSAPDIDAALAAGIPSIALSFGYTRVPVYEGTLDTPLGFAHLKDFALTHGFNGGTKPFDLAQMLRPLLFVPPSMPIGVLLAKMQAERRHMALVIDEYGGVDGLVTIEDLIEQVIGEIEDEHDPGEDQTWYQEKSGCYIALARTPLDEFEAEIGLSLTRHEDVDEEEIDTLGGLVFMLSGRVPARGEVIVHPEGPEFEVMDADPRRIKRLRVMLPGAKPQA